MAGAIQLRGSLFVVASFSVLRVLALEKGASYPQELPLPHRHLGGRHLVLGGDLIAAAYALESLDSDLGFKLGGTRSSSCSISAYFWSA